MNRRNLLTLCFAPLICPIKSLRQLDEVQSFKFCINIVPQNKFEHEMIEAVIEKIENMHKEQQNV